MDITETILRPDAGGEEYVVLRNTVGHCWHFPRRSIRRYLSLFQPSSLVGTAVAVALPWLARSRRALRLVKADVSRETCDAGLCDVLRSAFGLREVRVAMFCGTPGRHRKPTLLVWGDGRIAGYCKATASAEVAELFRREAATLSLLRERGVEHVPGAVFCGPWPGRPGLWLFCQTTERAGRVGIPTIADAAPFVRDMTSRTLVTAPLADTDFGAALTALEGDLALLGNAGQEAVARRAIAVTRRELGDAPAPWAASHGDLTPWNAFTVCGRFFAFDFEYARRTMPPHIDIFHFLTQQLTYDASASATAIWREYQRLRITTLAFVTEPDRTFRRYLLAVMAFYLGRDHGVLNERLGQQFAIWTELLRQLETPQVEVKIGGGYLNRLITRLKGESFTLDAQLPLGYLLSFLTRRVAMLAWGALTFRRREKMFVHWTATVRCRSRIRTLGTLTVEHGCLIDALSREGITFGRNVSVGMHTTIACTGTLRSLGRGLVVGDNVGLGTHGFFGCAGGVEIGSDTIFGNYVSLHSENHVFAEPGVAIRLQGVTHQGIIVGRGCWIGAKATLLDGTRLGDGCVVAAGAVVRGTVPPGAVVGGVPARVIKMR